MKSSLLLLPAKLFTVQCSFPSVLGGSLGEKEGKEREREKGQGRKREGERKRKKGEGAGKGEGEKRRVRGGERGRERAGKGREGRGKRGRERETDRKERRSVSQMHGIQKKQLSKALAGMQICRISGPIIPWHTKLAGGINVPKRGLQNKQQIKKTNTHNKPMN